MQQAANSKARASNQTADRDGGPGTRTESINLLLRGDDVGREQAADAEAVPLRHRERGALQQRASSIRSPESRKSATESSQGAPPRAPGRSGAETRRTRLNQGSWRMSGPRLWRTTGRWHSAVTYSRGCWERRRRRRRRSRVRDRWRFREMDAIPAPAASSRGGSGRWCQCPWVRGADRGSEAVALGNAFARIIPRRVRGRRGAGGFAVRGCPVWFVDAGRAADNPVLRESYERQC
jgi:hypothetical protein